MKNISPKIAEVSNDSNIYIDNKLIGRISINLNFSRERKYASNEK